MSVKQEKMGRTQIANASEKLEMQVKSRKKLKKKKKNQQFQVAHFKWRQQCGKMHVVPIKVFFPRPPHT